MIPATAHSYTGSISSEPKSANPFHPQEEAK
jgi:hypothetical protein